ncbi:hypothetical protein MM213_07695 [Belliella sp. R4-6]|uniref:Uncharacterized protein n=1 Tax=Belliella alkalica TaxID=1730871 RepID=A0ABS9VAC9_9BACT|nr:hypothetical protein [Belliella alkalica]MCH7413361.1 hypothetical protein [Belliella alkalica]
MSIKINSKYLENYALGFAKKVCDQYFSSKQYMTGTEILKLTDSKQVNFFVIKSLFEAWHVELEKLKSNPFFDYRDNSVHQALNEFMNVLSRSIKIDRGNFEPLLGEAVAFSVILALDPLSFFRGEIDKSSGSSVNDFLKGNEKYYKWNHSLIANLIDRAGISQSADAYKQALRLNFEQQKDQLTRPEDYLAELKNIFHLDLDILFEKVAEKAEGPIIEESAQTKEEALVEEDLMAEAVVKQEVVEPENVDNSLVEEIQETIQSPEKDEERFEEESIPNIPSQYKVASAAKLIDPLQAWEKFESEQYSVMKGSVGELSENVGINQRFMFTKELFDGNPDLMKHALKSIDQCDSFMSAITLINERYVGELDWDKNSEAVEEFLQLVFRKFDQRG